MKKLSNLNGVKALSKKEQQSINGGKNLFIGGLCERECDWPCNIIKDSECVPCNDFGGVGFECHIYG